MNISTESRMEFDYSVATEDRFALRKWLEQLVEAINYNDRGMYTDRLYDNLTVEGFTAQPMGKASYLSWLADRALQHKVHVIRFPTLRIKLKNNLYRLVGTFEEFVDGLLSYEGSIELLVVKTDDNFQLATMKFFPRLRLKEDEESTEL